MKTIYKYRVPINDVVTINLPLDAKILHVNSQNDGQKGDDTIDVWALVDTDFVGKLPKHIRIVGTGHPIEKELVLQYVNTFTMLDRNLWFHAFEIIKEEK
jgi:hypothetical protein